MSLVTIVLAAATTLMGAEIDHPAWQPFVSRDGNFVIDFPGKPNSSSRTTRSRQGMMKVVVTTCETPDVVYIAQKVTIPSGAGSMKPAEIDAILDFFAMTSPMTSRVR